MSEEGYQSQTRMNQSAELGIPGATDGKCVVVTVAQNNVSIIMAPCER
jgi:hypothetical protein